MALKDIKSNIASKLRTNKVTRAMEAVSAVKMRKTQVSALAGRPYARAALQILSRLSGTADVRRHALSVSRPVKATALVVITSDKGLAGSLNSGVIKAAAEAIEGRPKGSVRVYAYGKKGEDYFARRGYTIEKSFDNKRDDVPTSVMEDLAKELSAGFVAGLFDEALVAYSNFKSTFEQLPTSRRILPLSVDTVKELVADIIPVRGKWSDEAEGKAPAAYTVEPSAEVVLNSLVPRLVAVSLYHMLLESKASEHSARMVAMKNASDKSKEVAKELTRQFNKIRQAQITREVSEIVGGREALAQ
jgi:F-type H+-transporting ATPase subunit gamma